MAEVDSQFNQEEVEIIGVDYDSKSLKLGRAIATAYNIEEKSLRYLKGNVFQLEHLKKFGTRINWHPNIILASGLIEYLDDRKAQDALRQIYEALEKNGLFLFFNQQNNPSKKLMEKVCTTKDGPWILYYRQPNILYEWLTQVGFADVHVQTDRWRMYDLFAVRK